MNIKLIDQALTAAITGLIYGSEIWFTYALSLYVVRRSLSRSHPGTIQIDIFPSAKKPVEVAVEQALLEPALKLTLKPALEQPVTSQSILSTQNSLDLPLIAPALPITEVTKVIKSQKKTRSSRNTLLAVSLSIGNNGKSVTCERPILPKLAAFALGPLIRAET